jgi:Cu+-exporting ATPase
MQKVTMVSRDDRGNYRTAPAASPRPLYWYRARRFPRAEVTTMAIDPVCGMQVDPAKAAGTSDYQGKTYYFCAKSCKAKFDANPGQYAK